MIQKRSLLWIAAVFALAWAAPLRAENALPDSEFTLEPTFAVYRTTSFEAQSPSRTFTVTNKGASAFTLGAVDLAGPHPEPFFITADGCSNRELAPGGSCIVQVAFQPTNLPRAALLQIPSNDPETPMLTAYLTNQEDTATEAKRRMPPVLQSLDLPETMQADQPYSITWSLLGYEESYTTNIVFFDCSVDPENCGAAYTDSSRFAESGNITFDSAEDGDWSYRGFLAMRFNFSYTFTPPFGRFSTATDVVVRFYNKSVQDDAALLPSLSLLLPGNLPGVSYNDSEGRRLRIIISP